MIPPVILASQSPRRRELLEKTGIPFSIIVRGTEELKEASMPPQELCLHNAAAKAETVFQEHRRGYARFSGRLSSWQAGR